METTEVMKTTKSIMKWFGAFGKALLRTTRDLIWLMVGLAILNSYVDTPLTINTFYWVVMIVGTATYNWIVCKRTMSY